MTQTMKIQRINECGISLPPSVHFIAADVVVLTTKLRIARTCVAYLTEPLDREIRQDCIQFGRHLRDHFKLACGSIG
ncbi:hypothetical protein IVA90_09160 [Bradyrhizobium sp. 151]|nr:hypothetical protein [Bradyrhizobium sp. 151]